MSQKTTRSATELKAVATELCNSKDFLQTICEYVAKCSKKVNEAKFEPLEKSVDENKKAIDELKCVKKENEELKTVIAELKEEILKLKSMQAVKTANRSKNQNIDRGDKRNGQIVKEIPSNGNSSRNTSEDEALLLSQVTSPVAKDNEGEFRTKYRRRRKQEQKIGTANIDESCEILAGAAQPKMAWLYIGRIKNKNVMETDILNYLKGKESEAEFKVSKLESKGPFASFKVGAPFTMLEKLNTEDFWPSGICIRRFNFWNYPKKSNDFLGKPPKGTDR